MHYLKNKNIIIEGVEATGKTTLIQNLKDIYPFSIIQPSNYLENSQELFANYRVLIGIHSGLLFDRLFLTRSAVIKDQEKMLFLYADMISDKNRLVLLECNYDKIIKRMSDKKKLKFSYKDYSFEDIPFIAEDMRDIYDEFEKHNPNYCLRIDTGKKNREETLETVLNFMKR